MKSFLLPLLALGSTVLSAQAQWVNQPIGFADPTAGALFPQVLDANNVWVVSEGANAYSAPQVARTTDGGQTWTVRTLPLRTTQREYVEGLSVVSPSTAWIITVPSDSVGSRILRTTDAGQTWTVQGRGTTFASPNSYANFVHFFSATEGLVAGEQLASGAPAEMYRTTDAGLTWTPVTTLPPMLGVEYLSGQPAVVGNNIWFMTNEGRVFRSADRGQTWAVNTLPVNVEGTGLAFRDAQNGLLSVLNESRPAHALFRTTDGGQSWARVSYTGPLHGIGLSAVPGTNRYVSTGANVGNNDQGSSYTTDNGQTWIPLESTVNHLFVKFASPTAGWSTGAIVGGGSNGLLGNGVNKFTSSVLSTRAAETAAQAGWQLAPNPTADGRTSLQALRPFGAATQVRVRDVTGRLVRQYTWAGTAPLTLDLSQQDAGLYVVEVAGAAGSSYQKVQVR